MEDKLEERLEHIVEEEEPVELKVAEDISVQSTPPPEVKISFSLSQNTFYTFI